MPHPTKYQFQYSNIIEVDGILARSLIYLGINTEFYQADCTRIEFPFIFSLQGNIYEVGMYLTEDDYMMIGIKDQGQWDFFKWKHSSALGPSQRIQNIVTGLKKVIGSKIYYTVILDKLVQLQRASIKSDKEGTALEVLYRTMSEVRNGNLPWTTTREEVLLDTANLTEDESFILSLFLPNTDTTSPHYSKTSHRDAEEALFILTNKAYEMDEKWKNFQLIIRDPITDKVRRIHVDNLTKGGMRRVKIDRDNSRYVSMEDVFSSSNFILFLQTHEPK